MLLHCFRKCVTIIMPPKRKLSVDNKGNFDISAMFKKQGKLCLSRNYNVIAIKFLPNVCSVCSTCYSCDYGYLEILFTQWGLMRAELTLALTEV